MLIQIVRSFSRSEQSGTITVPYQPGQIVDAAQETAEWATQQGFAEPVKQKMAGPPLNKAVESTPKNKGHRK